MSDRLDVNGQTYVTAAGAVAAFQGDQPATDVTAAMIRAWARRHQLTKHRAGGRVYYPLAALRQAEKATHENRATHGGRPRPRILTNA